MLSGATPADADSHHVRMDWTDEGRYDIGVALNESEVVGVRLDPSGSGCDLLLHVLALPEVGPIDPDPRRILRLLAPGVIRVYLHEDRPPGSHEPAIPLASLDAVEEFFASLSSGETMYGWTFFDEPRMVDTWPHEVSLEIGSPISEGAHSIYWFNECSRDEGGKRAAYCIEGTVTFRESCCLPR